jgi:hypothetical protein
MRIGIVSDTHLQKGDELPPELTSALRGVDMILHAGDLVDLEVAVQLEKVAPVRVVYGNMDGAAVRGRCLARMVVEANGRKIGLIHGSGAPESLARRVRQEFEDVDVIVFGHSHQAMSQTMDGVLMFNPGSPTDRVFARQRTCGTLEIGEPDGPIVPRIIQLP